MDVPPSHRLNHKKLHILHICAHMPLVHGHEIFGQYDLYFKMAAIFFFHILTTNASMANHRAFIICIDTWSNHTKIIGPLWPTFSNS